MVVDLSRQVRVIFSRRFQHDFRAVGEIMLGQIDLSEGSFSDQLSERIVSDMPKVFGGKLSATVRPYATLRLFDSL